MGQAVLEPHCTAGAALALDGMDWSGFRATRFWAAVEQAYVGTCREAGELVTASALQ